MKNGEYVKYVGSDVMVIGFRIHHQIMVKRVYKKYEIQEN